MRHLLFILTTELLVREWGVSCGSRDEATVGSNCDDDDREVMSIPTTISWDPGVLLLLIIVTALSYVHVHTLRIFRCKMLQ